jgi:hypothetical protein
VVGALAGFGLGFLASTNLALLGIDSSGWPTVGFGILGAVGGGVVGSLFQSPSGRARRVAWWCVTMAVGVGAVAFLVGFVGPMVLHPDWPQGPILGIFCTGPLGTLAGALLGAVIGLLIPAPSALR